MNELTHVEVIVIGKPLKPPKFVGPGIAIRLSEIINTANALSEVLNLQEINGIRLLLKCYGVEVEQ